MRADYTITERARSIFACVGIRIISAALLCLGAAGGAFAQDLRTRDLLLDDDATSQATRNTITLRSPADASLLNDYVFRLPNSNGLGAGSLLYVESYTGSTALTRWLAPSPSSVLTSDLSGIPVWQSLSSLLNISQEWVDGDSIGVPGVIYAAQALQSGTADTVVVTDAGRVGVGTATPGGLITVRGSGHLFRGEESGGTLRSVLHDDGEQDWYLGGMTGEEGQAQVGTTSGFPSFSLYRPGATDRFDILNHSTYTAIGYNADGVVGGNVLTIAQGGNVGIGVSAPSAKLHVSATTDPLRLQGLVQDPALDSVLVVDGQGVVHWTSADNLISTTIDSAFSANAWLLTGNAGTNASTNFLGTTDAQPLVFRTNNTEGMRLAANRFVGIGATNPLEKLHLSGGNIRMDNQGGHTIEMRSTGTANKPIGDLRFYESDTTWFGSFSFSGEPNMFYFTGGSGAGDIDTLMAIDAQGTNKGYVGIGLAPATDAALRQKLQVHDGNILLSNSGTAGELRFEEPSASGLNYSAFRAKAQSADITYILPDTAAIVGDVLRVASVSGTTLTLDWGTSSGSGSGTAWLLTGNAGTNPTSNFLGTTDNTALEIRVNNSRVMRYDPRTASPNITGGYSGNSITTGQDGNVIAGGGVSGATNQIGSGVNYSFIGGGTNNQMYSSSSYGVVAGGYNNRLTSTADHSAIVGGEDHQIDNTQYAFIGGGDNNRLTSDADYSVITGGNNNQIDNGQYLFIGGGNNNRLTSDADYSVITGGNNNQIDNAQYAVAGGGNNNQLNSDADYSGIGSGSGNQISNGQYGFVGSGSSNQINSDADYSFVGSGSSNQISGGQYSVIGSGSSNIIGSSSNYSFIGSGSSNQVSSASDRSAIGSGSSNQIDNTQYSFIGSGNSNRLTSDADYSAIVGGQNHQIDNGQYVFIGGGNNNRLTSDADYSSVIGGNGNQIDNGQYSLIGGGNNNRLTSDADYSLIVGGNGNQIDNGQFLAIVGGANHRMNSDADYAIIGAGEGNTISAADYAIIGAGQGNTASASHSVVGGGQGNTVSASHTVVAGGQSNTAAGSYSAIPGGRGLTLSGSRSFGFLGGNTGSNNMSVATSDIAIFGNTDLWLGNNDNSASQIRLFEPNSTTGSFPGAANYSSFESQAQSADIRYLLPSAAGSAGTVLSIASVVGTTVTLQWGSASSNEWLLAGNAGTNPSTNFLGTTDNQPVVFRTNNLERMRLGTSYNLQGGNGTTASGSNSYAWGSLNTASADYSVVAGGAESRTSATHGAIGGGYRDTVSATYATIAGGAYNNAAGSYAAIPGGARLTLGANSFGFNNATTASTQTNLSSFSNLSYFGNTNVWVGNTDNTARAVQFYEPNSSYTYTGTNYTSLRAQAQAQDIDYIFPDTAGAVGDVLMVKSKTGTQVVLDWAKTSETSAIGSVLFSRKTADETVSGTTLQNDDHLILALEANKAYEVRGTLYCERVSGTANLNLAWTVPGGTGTGTGNSTMLIAFYAFERKNSGNRDIGGDTRTSSGTGAPDGAGEVGLSTNLVVVTITGMVITGTNAGNLTLQWAPSTGPTDQVKVLKNSFMAVSVAQ